MKVFLGGTCNGSQWREFIIPQLRIDYFNPVVADWTPECQAEELKQRVECDYCLFCVTPKMTGVYSIAEVVDDSNKRPHRTVFVPLQRDECDDFTPGQWKSLMAVADMVVRNGGNVFYTLHASANFLNSMRT